MNKEIPCVDCLILGICKSRMEIYYQEEIGYQNRSDDNDPYPFYEFGESVEEKRQSLCVERLTYECQLILDYIYSVKKIDEDDQFYSEDEKRTRETMELFFEGRDNE